MAIFTLTLVFCLLFHVIPFCHSAGVTIDVGIMISQRDSNPSHSSSWAKVGSAISIAIEDFQKTGWLTDVQFKEEEQCDLKIAISGIARLYYDFNPDVIFGPSCSTVLIYVGIYAANWNLPIFTAGGSVPDLGNKTRYSSMVTGQAPTDRIAGGYPRIMYEFGWSRIAMLTSGGWCAYSSSAIYDALERDGVNVVEWIQADDDAVTDLHIDRYLERLRERTRIILVCIRNVDSQNRVLKQAYKKGMIAPDFAFVLFRTTNHVPISTPWYIYDNMTEQEFNDFKFMLQKLNFKGITIAIPEGEQYESFYDLIPERLAQHPWYFNLSLENGWRGTYRALYLYDVVWTYLDILNETLNEGKGPEYYRNGSYMLQMTKGRTLNGITGKFRYDESGSRLPNLVLWSFNPEINDMQQVGIINVAETFEKRFRYIEGKAAHWEDSPNQKPPLDVPVCGFKGELCEKDESGNSTIIIIAIVVVVIVIMAIGIIAFILKRRKDEMVLNQMKWRIHFHDITIGEKRVGSMTAISQKKLGSIDSGSEAGDRLDMRQLFTEIGTYKNTLVAILRVDKERIKMGRADLQELNLMKDMKHDNLTEFVGACVDPPNLCYIMQYCPKGSLQDVIENSDIGLDWAFKTSLIFDLCQGLDYIHRSDLGSHGSLKSSCCLIDSRWQLKITSYGLHAFRGGHNKDIGDYEQYKKLLWTAPEFLRGQKKPKYGTKKGDIYSYGIIVHEMVYRGMAYGLMEPATPKDIVMRVKKLSDPPYRPATNKTEEGMNPQFIDLMKTCWDEEPSNRPTCQAIAKLIRDINQGKDIDIMGTIIDKLEKYANNLEGIVASRTTELIVEKKKTDSLLYRMLPQSVAEQLKLGNVVQAELYDEVTVYFSDIVGFTQLSLASTPLEIVNLLNDLYNMFDDMISQHDVYKVETISDSYMVVSGLPKRNGKKHVGHIATLALDLMSAAHTEFRIRHRPGDKLQLRIGFHTGPCAAGVVGLSMPRFCLFGDTVNMASRMETNGKALRIHMSKYSYAALDALGGYSILPRGEMQIKGKGLQMTYWLVGKQGFTKPLPDLTDA